MWQLGNSSCPFSAEHTQHDKKCQLTNKVGQGLSILQRDFLELMADFSWPFLNVIKYLPDGVINLESMCGTIFCRASNIHHDITACPLVLSWFGDLLASFPKFLRMHNLATMAEYWFFFNQVLPSFISSACSLPNAALCNSWILRIVLWNAARFLSYSVM